MKLSLLGDPEVTANIYCKLRNLPNTDAQNYSTDLRKFLGHPVLRTMHMRFKTLFGLKFLVFCNVAALKVIWECLAGAGT